MHEITYRDNERGEIKSLYTDTPETVITGLLLKGCIIITLKELPYGPKTNTCKHRKKTTQLRIAV